VTNLKADRRTAITILIRSQTEANFNAIAAPLQNLVHQYPTQGTIATFIASLCTGSHAKRSRQAVHFTLWYSLTRAISLGVALAIAILHGISMVARSS
jgi:hypothetical protein